MTVHPDGSVLVGGEFDRVHGMSLRGLARLNGGVKGFEFGATVWNADEGAALRFEMPRGQSHRLQASEDLASWTDLFGGRVLLNETTVKDVQSIGNKKRYYRALRGE